MRTYTIDSFKLRLLQLKMSWPDCQLIGVRSNADTPNQFDDMFYWLEKGVIKGIYTGTTNAGAYYLQNFINKAAGGTAILAHDQQLLNGFQLGKYSDREAWRQYKPSKIYRDSDKDLKAEELGLPEIGMWSIHIHAMFKKGKSLKIWNWSAGCQGLNDEEQWGDFMKRSKAQGNLLNYTLLQEF